MSSAKCDFYPGLGSAKAIDESLSRGDFQKDVKGWGKDRATGRGWRLCKKIIFWAIMEGCLIAIGIDDLIDCAEFSLAEETNRRYARTTAKERVINETDSPRLWGSSAV